MSEMYGEGAAEAGIGGEVDLLDDSADTDMDPAAEDRGGDDRLEDDELESALEAVLLVIDAPAGAAALASAVGEPTERVEATLRRMSGALTARRSGIDLRSAAEGWRYYTRNEYAPYVERLLLDGARSKLTRAALETLAVVAYRQPLTRARVSAVRGVNVDGVMRTLIARGLVAEAGTDPDTNAITYATTELFLERLGLSSLADLPPLAPLLPDVDVIDDISEDVESDPRFARLRPAAADSGVGVDTRVDDDN